ncbi:MAG: glycosyltransferase family 2 protein [Deltaproteobacteria bacterium]|nr:glycosyltransferase family 2 protein [Deltaproteobacteria bacterium]
MDALVVPRPLDPPSPGAPSWSGGWLHDGRRHWLVARRGRLRLHPAPGASFALLAFRLLGPGRTTLCCTLQLRRQGLVHEYGPYFGVALAPWKRHVLTLALPVAIEAGDEIEITVAREPWWQAAQPLRVAVERAWLAGPQATHEQVTIVVLNWKRADETARCVESLQRADLHGARILIVDNGSGDGSAEQLRARFPDVELLALPENRGYAGGNNAGIRRAIAAGARAVLVLNNDTVVAEDFFTPLLWALNADPHVAAVTSVILRMDRPDMLESAFLEIYWGHGIVRHFGVNALPAEGFNYRREVGVAVGCSVLLSVDALQEIGLLNEEFFAYHEEVDWCARAARGDWRVIYEPLSRVWHDRSKSTGELSAPLTVARSVARGPQLPNPVPLTWNPVKVYLGARNAVRFIHLNASPKQRLYFWLHSAYAVPLEALAAVMRQESALKIGAWSYRRALEIYCTDGDTRPAPPLWRQLLALPRILLWDLPRDLRLAQREGRLREIAELLRGLRDGLLRRPLPLQRLKLR